MRKLVTIAGVAAVALSVPMLASADGQPRGKGRGHSVNPATCPPGLANRGCLPPGQARRLFREGQRVPRDYRNFSDHDDIPLAYRDRFGIPTGYRYIYRDNTVYVVDPTTSLVRTIIDLID